MSTRPSRFLGRRASSLVPLSFLCVLLGSHASLSASQSYRVRLSVVPPLRATVDATVLVRDGVLRTGAGGADNLPRRWGTFVSDLRAFDPAGVLVAITEHQSPDSYAGEWRAGDGYTGPLRISYVVDLAFTQKPWPPSNEKAGTFDGKAIYLVTKSLFLGSVDDGPSRVSFELPDGARLVTPWNALQGQPNTFDVPTMQDLQRNTIVAGDFAADEIHAGPFTLRLVLLGDLRGSRHEASRALRAFALRYVRIFPETPKSAYLLTIFAANDEDGEAFEGSAAFVTRAPLTREGTIMWANTQGHELFHLWCGQQIRGADEADSEWFQEGFTEYYANLTLTRAGLVGPGLFVKKMENMLGKYLYFRTAPQFAEVSLRDAGKRKTSWRFGVYNGGWAAAFGLDMTIRQRTNGRRTLDDFMRAMYVRFGLTHRTFRYEDLVRTASEAAGSDLDGPFFRKYVAGKEVLPVGGWLTDLGYAYYLQDYAAELYLIPGPETPLRRDWLSDRP